jgi:hypothetical protein
MTDHCAHLESLGLVCRERRGNVVRVSRTEDGDRLVDLLA